jgi:Flp pilus assembly protein TadB
MFSVAFWFMVAVVVTAGLSFVSLVVWLGQRDKERKAQEAHYRNETVRKIAESGESAAALEYLREIDRAQAQRTRNGLRLGGLITIAAGVGLMVFLHQLVARDVYLVGSIPVLVGVAILVYTELFVKPAS